MSVITLLTDFGDRDAYVAAMKGVILSVAPRTTLIDITHHIPAQDIMAAGMTLCGAFPYFPDGTIHLAVVDPGVGSDRGIIAASTGNALFLAPDNGLLGPVMAQTTVQSAVRVTHPQFFRRTVSNTFHGRDIFAPVAAHLASGVPMSRLGPAISLDAIHRIPFPKPVFGPDSSITGVVIHKDHFGNLITNITRTDMDGFDLSALVVTLGDTATHAEIRGLVTTYAAVDPGEPLALLNSSGYLEIAVAQGDASAHFRLAKMTKVTVKTAIPLSPVN